MCENCVKYTKNNMVSLQEYYLLVDLLATSMGGTSGFSAVLRPETYHVHILSIGSRCVFTASHLEASKVLWRQDGNRVDQL